MEQNTAHSEKNTTAERHEVKRSPLEYRLTTLSCFTGIFVEAIITTITAILYIPLRTLYGFGYVELAIFVGINFASQVAADIIFSGLIDKIGYRKITLATCVLAFAGLILYGLTPNIFGQHIFAGFLISTIIFAFACGLLEIILSPIIDAIPNDDKGPAMSLMHSFYAWGQVATIIVTTLFIYIAGAKNWQWIVFFWTLVPLCCFFMFLKSKMPPQSIPEERPGAVKMMKNPFYIFALIAILFGGATEVFMAQWSSSFFDQGLHLPKIAGDLLGMCGFALMLGLGRVFYGIYGAKINMNKILIAGSAACILCYITVALSPVIGLSVIACGLTGLCASLLWPGVIVVCSEHFPTAGAWMFAILAAAGDIGAGTSPYIKGFITDYAQNTAITRFFADLYNTDPAAAAMRVGILAAIIFPLGALIANINLYKKRIKIKNNE